MYIKTRKNAIVEYLDYQIPVTQLNEVWGDGHVKAAATGYTHRQKGNGGMQAEICKQQSETKCATYRRYTEVRHLPAVDSFKRYGS